MSQNPVYTCLFSLPRQRSHDTLASIIWVKNCCLEASLTINQIGSTDGTTELVVFVNRVKSVSTGDWPFVSRRNPSPKNIGVFL